ncbi:putative calcium-transporting ATPase 11, plasma membrane-type [Camellia lanceoleosa]|uniref:Calcium-transporting ATPase 11, plasma membrane-type n=1 Tax=Camellia lanceoleosa TaxID=1840588 RepID=A0ACC0G7D1_9ERIC|nr:putative calcium-transporting ATPase 11, plasma membrane-type [Camellia lanceoleosa]
MESLLKDFDIPAKNPSEEAQRRWRCAVTVVKNRRRRFRMIVDLAKKSEAKTKLLKIQEHLKTLFYVQKAAIRFLDGAGQGDELSKEAREAGFRIHPNQLASVVRSHDTKGLELFEGVMGAAKKVNVSLDEGVKSSDIPIREKIYGFNRYTEKPSRGFWMFVWEALQDITLIILMVCAVVSIVVGLATEGWPKGMYDGLGIILSIFFGSYGHCSQ